MLPTRSAFHRHALLAATCLLLLLTAAHGAFAGTVKYPAEKPFFTFELPAKWTSKVVGGATNALYCKTGDGSVNLQFYTVDNSELNDDLPAFAKGALAMGKMKDIEVAKVGDETVGDGLPVKFVRSTFKNPDGVAFVSLIISLPMKDDTTCVFHYFLPEALLDDNKADFEKITASIKLVK